MPSHILYRMCEGIVLFLIYSRQYPNLPFTYSFTNWDGAHFFSMMISSNFAEQAEEGTAADYLAVPFLLFLPLIMIFVAIIRKLFKKKAS